MQRRKERGSIKQLFRRQTLSVEGVTANVSYIKGTGSLPLFPRVENYTHNDAVFADIRAFISSLASTSASRQLLFFFISFFFLNLVFAALLFLDIKGIDAYGHKASTLHWPFSECFFLSVQSMTSIGYGAIHPKSIYCNIIITIESFVSVVFFSLLTAVVISRFLRPAPQWAISNVACVYFDDIRKQTVLQVRVVFEPGVMFTDMRADAEAEVFIHSMASEGSRATVTKPILFENNKSLVRGCMWVLTHVVDDNSPLKNAVELLLSKESLDQADTMAIRDLKVQVSGTDPYLMSQTCSIQIYGQGDILLNRIFVDMLSLDEKSNVPLCDACMLSETMLVNRSIAETDIEQTARLSSTTFMGASERLSAFYSQYSALSIDSAVHKQESTAV